MLDREIEDYIQAVNKARSVLIDAANKQTIRCPCKELMTFRFFHHIQMYFKYECKSCGKTAYVSEFGEVRGREPN